MGFMTSPASESMQEILSRLDLRIQTVDEERWLSSRYADARARDALIILYAFYYELARVRVAVTDQMMGSIRFQWWRDALEELARGEIRQHDVVLALASLKNELWFDVSRLTQVIDQHEAAFLSHDRSDEPEALLLDIAVRIVGADEFDIEELNSIAIEWAALRRGETIENPIPKQTVPTRLRPVAAHYRLRHAWLAKKNQSALQKRLSVLRAMLTGTV